VLGIISLVPFSTVGDFALTTIPMFILMAYLSASSGLARDLYKAGEQLAVACQGGLAIATVFACGIFGRCPARASRCLGHGEIAMPEMRRYGYSDELAAGSIGVGATLDILIPPSVAMVIYGIATQTSIGKLLIGRYRPPGFWWACSSPWPSTCGCWSSPKHAPRTKPRSSAERWASVRRIWPSGLLIGIVIALLYSGVATPPRSARSAHSWQD